MQDVVAAIHKVGFDVVEQTLTLELSGMSSERCAERIQAALEALPDVHATVLFASSRASVCYLPRVVSPEQMVRAIEKGGFQAHVVDGGQRGDERERRERASGSVNVANS